MSRNKKGILLSEGVKLFLAVIVLFFLIILAYQLYGIFTVKHEREQAKETLNAIVGKIESLEYGETKEYLVIAPKGWYLVSYSKDELNPNTNYFIKLFQENTQYTTNIPSQCKGEDCLCICKYDIDLQNQFFNIPVSFISSHKLIRTLIQHFFSLDKQVIATGSPGIEACEKGGICENLNKTYVSNEVPYKISIPREEGTATDTRWISLHTLPKKIELKSYGDEKFIT